MEELARIKAKEMLINSIKLGNSYCAERHCQWLCDEIIKEIDETSVDDYQRYRILFWQEVKYSLRDFKYKNFTFV